MLNKEKILVLAEANPNKVMIEAALENEHHLVFSKVKSFTSTRDKAGKKLYIDNDNKKNKLNMPFLPSNWTKIDSGDYDADTIANNALAGIRLSKGYVYVDMDIKDARDADKAPRVIDTLLIIQILKESGLEININNLPSFSDLTDEQQNRFNELSVSRIKAYLMDGESYNNRESVIAKFGDNIDDVLKDTNSQFRFEFFVNSAKGSELELRSSSASIVYLPQLGDNEKGKTPFRPEHINNEIVIYNEFFNWVVSQGVKEAATAPKRETPKSVAVNNHKSDFVREFKAAANEAYNSSNTFWDEDSEDRERFCKEWIAKYNEIHNTTFTRESSVEEYRDGIVGNGPKIQHQEDASINTDDGKFMCAVPALIFFKNPYGWDEYNKNSYNKADCIENDDFYKFVMEKFNSTFLSKWEEEVWGDGVKKGQKKYRYNPALVDIKYNFYHHPVSGKIFTKLTDNLQGRIVFLESVDGAIQEHERGNSNTAFENFIQDCCADSKFKLSKTNAAEVGTAFVNLVNDKTQKRGIINHPAIKNPKYPTFNIANPTKNCMIMRGESKVENYVFPLKIVKLMEHLFAAYTDDKWDGDYNTVHRHNPQLNNFFTILAEKSRQSVRDLVMSFCGPHRIGKDSGLIKLIYLLFDGDVVSISSLEPLSATHSSDLAVASFTHAPDIKFNNRTIDTDDSVIKTRTGSEIIRSNPKYKQPRNELNNNTLIFTTNNPNPLLENDERMWQTSVSGGYKMVNGKRVADDKCLAEVDWIVELEYITDDGVKLTNVSALHEYMKEEIESFAQYLHNIYIKDTPKRPTRSMFLPTPKAILKRMNSARGAYRSFSGTITSAQKSQGTAEYDMYLDELVSKLCHSQLFKINKSDLVRRLTSHNIGRTSEVPAYSGLLYNFITVDLLTYLLNLIEYPLASQTQGINKAYTTQRLEQRLVEDYVEFAKDSNGDYNLQADSKYIELPNLRERIFKELNIDEETGKSLVKMSLGKEKIDMNILDNKQEEAIENKQKAQDAARADETMRRILEDLK